MSALMDKEVSHDQISRMLNSQQLKPKERWQMVRPAVRYLLASDASLTAEQLITIYNKRWKVEEYHGSQKQNTSLSLSPTRTLTTQTNYSVATLWSFAKLEVLNMGTKKYHYAPKKHTCIFQPCNRLSMTLVSWIQSVLIS